MTETVVVARARWGGPTGRALAVGMVLVLVAPAVGVAQPDDPGPPSTAPDGELGDLDAAQEQARRQLAVIEARTGDAREVLAAVVADLDDTELARAQAERDLAAATTARDVALARAERAEARLVEVTAGLATTEVELAARRAQLEARVRAGFKYGQVSFLEVFLGTADIAEFLNSNIYVASVLEGDRALVEDVSRLLDTVQRQRAAIVALRDEADRSLVAAEAAAVAMATAVVELDAMAATIEQQRREQVIALAALEDDRASIESHLSGLEVESQRIGNQLAAIAAQQAEEAARQEAAEQARLEQEALEAAHAAERLAEERRAAAEREASLEQEAAAGAPAAGSGSNASGRGSASSGSGSSGSAPPTSDGSGSDGSGSEGSGSEGSGSDGSGSSGSGSDGSGSSGSGSDSASGSGGRTATPAPDGSWVRPVPGRLTSGFGPRWGRSHNGVDLAGTVGSGVVAARPGTVVYAVSSCHPTSSFGCGGGFGNYVLIAHPGGLATIYAHLSSVAVVVGDGVAAGQGVGGVGNSGNSYGSHLHFEIRDAGAPRNPCGYISC